MLSKNIQCAHTRYSRDDSALRISSCSHVYAQNGWVFSSHRHDRLFELILVIAGEGALRYDGRTFQTEEGDLLVINSGALHEEASSLQNPVEALSIQMTGVNIEGCHVNQILPDNAVPVVKAGRAFSVLRHLFAHVELQRMEKKEGFEAVLHDEARAILSIATQLLVEQRRLLEPKESRFPAIGEITEYLDHHYSDPITLEQLANRFHFSTFYIARKFKDETGYTIHQYITNRRIGEAERLLVFEKISIKEIAAKTGFSSLNHFYSTFKKYTGGSPGQFRDMYANR